jgi:hypothetical protein
MRRLCAKRLGQHYPKQWRLSFIVGFIIALCGSCGDGRSPAKSLVVLNEIKCYSRDWIEIVNVSGVLQDISSWYVADKPDKDGHQYQLPAGTVMQVDEYLVIKKKENLEVGFEFGFTCGEETAYLLDSNKAIVDQVDIGNIDYSNTWGRLPNITGIWRETYPTPGEENQPPLTGL